MRYTDNLTALLTPAAKPPLEQPTLADIAVQLVRIETRLVKLMHRVGLDANGHIREGA